MKSALKFALALSIFVGVVTAQASAASSCPPKTLKITKRWQLHDGCHRRHAQMLGKPCH